MTLLSSPNRLEGQVTVNDLADRKQSLYGERSHIVRFWDGVMYCRFPIDQLVIYVVALHQ